MLKIQFRAMGCRMAAFVDGESADAARALAAVPGWFEAWEQALSRFRSDSGLSRLNRAPLEQVEVDPLLLEVIECALHSAEWTGGLVAPNLLDQLEQAGYRKSFELLQIGPDVAREDCAAQSGPVASWRQIQVDRAKGVLRRPVGMRIDLGGVGKGWAANQAARLLEPFGPALVDAGGDIAVSGVRLDGSLWPVAIADPLNVQENLGVLTLGRCGVATSGTDYRNWTHAGKRQHHMIDPRSGRPAESDLVSVTVVAPDVEKAEAAAKAVLISGSQSGLDWLQAHHELSALMVRPNGALLYAGDFEKHLWRTREYAF